MMKFDWQNRKRRHGVADLRFASWFFVILGAAALTSGCAINNGGIPADLVTTDQIVTGSVTQATKVEGVDATDAEVIKDRVVSGKTASEAKPLSWVNDETGSSGSIVAINRFSGSHGQNCRKFKTTVATFTGVSFYNGEACELSTDKWVLSWFKPDS